MNASQHLAEQYRRALEGGAWHGPSWREALEGVSREAAVAHPVAGAHSIAEIVAHTAAWHDVVRRRLAGDAPQISEAESWPAAAPPDDGAWAALVETLLDSGRALREQVAAFPATRLHDARPGLSDTWYGLILGELQHMLYHAGQIVVLQRAVSASR